jgi:hypothetical protein
MDTGTDNTLTQPTESTTPPTGGGGGGMAAAADAANAMVQPKQPSAPGTSGVTDVTSSTTAMTPTPVHPVRRKGLAGIVDEIADALAGSSVQHVYHDDQGNMFVKRETPSRGQQWLRIAATAFHGAAAGLSQHGPGSKGRAGLAGIEAGEEDVQKQKQGEKDQQQQVTQDQLNKYSMIKLKQDVAANDFALKRLQVKGSEDDVTFAQNQIDRERTLGSADLGVYSDMADLARVKQAHPEFWKDVYANNIVTVPEIAPDGSRKGIHVFLRTKGVGDELVPAETKVWDYQPGQKPTDPPQLVQRTLSGPATYNQVEAWNNAAYKKKSDWLADQAKTADTASQAKLRDAQTKEAEAKAVEARASAAKNFSEARKAKIEADNLGQPSDDDETNAQQIAAGRMAPSQVRTRAKGEWAKIMARADALHLAQTGQHLDVAQAEVNYQVYKKTIERFSDGEGAQNIQSFDKFLGHALEASESVNGMRNSNVKLVNTPYNKLRELSGSATSPQLLSGIAKLETVRKEYETFLENNHALTVQDKEQGKKILDDNATPAQMQAALKAMAGISIVRLRSEDFGFSRVTHSHLPDLVSPEGAAALQHFGYDPKSVYSKNATTPTTPQAAQPVPKPPQAVGTARSHADGKLHWTDGKNDLGLAE